MRTLVMVILLVPLLPIAWAWIRLARARASMDREAVLATALLSITTLSFVVFFAGMMLPVVIGPDYSRRRFATIGVNLGAMGLVTLLASLATRRFRPPLVLSSTFSGVVWVYAAAMSSMV